MPLNRKKKVKILLNTVGMARLRVRHIIASAVSPVVFPRTTRDDTTLCITLDITVVC